MKLYTYYRGSSPYRVRIALNLKGLQYEPVFVHLVKGEQRLPEYLAVNPQGLVPTLIDGDVVITQSLAIIEYLEEKYSSPPLLPKDPVERARVRSLALAIACDVHPLNNVRVLNYLRDEFSIPDEGRTRWYQHWVIEALSALERRMADDPHTGRFCHGEQPGLADVFLVPQLLNARRYKVDLGPYPTLTRIEHACLELDAFVQASPARQPDAPTHEKRSS